MVDLLKQSKEDNKQEEIAEKNKMNKEIEYMNNLLAQSTGLNAKKDKDLKD